MISEPITRDEFRREIEEAMSFSLFAGLQTRSSSYNTGPMWDAVVYLGANVAFTFYLDIRDDVIDAIVTRVRDGKLFELEEGGYRSNLFGHLMRHCGWRGPGTSRIHPHPSWTSAKRMVSGIVELLQHQGCQKLLADDPDAMPA